MEQKLSCLRDFQVLCKLGEGAFGQVYKVKRRADGKEYALKKIKIGSMKPKQKQNALNEVRILASYNHEYIIGFKQAFYDEISQTLCVVMQFASGGDLLKTNQQHLKRYTKYKEEQIWTALVHMTTGLKSLHDKKILHRDLKCANVFITADKIYKLGDLNVSKVLKKDFACTQTGTPYYASPEVWKDQPYGVKSDMWSLGCVLYEMAALKPPFTARDLSGLYKKVCAGIFDRIPFQFSNDLQAVIGSLLKLDPKKRPDTDELLSNPFVHKHYKGSLEMEATEECNVDPLLQTIKYNPRDLKGLKNNLPKANYIQEIKQENQAPQSVKIIRKQPDFKKQEKKEEEKKKVEEEKKKIEEENKKLEEKKKEERKKLEDSQKKLKEYMEKRRKVEERQREEQLRLLKEHNQQLLKKKDRVLSACGLRNQYICESPRIAVHKKDDSTPVAPFNSCRPTKKDDNSLPNAKLPPKPQGLPNYNYKLPPKPSYHIPNSGVNRSSEAAGRDSSKENLKNIGARIVNDVRPVMTPKIGRSNSAQKVIYPCWWS